MNLIRVKAMKSVRTAAFALVGWYLMVAPETHIHGFHFLDKNGNPIKQDTATIREFRQKAMMIHPEAPVTEWTQAGAFDTASTCEAERLKLKPMDDFAKCIASDDPRLKGN